MTEQKHTPGSWEEFTPADNIWPPRVFAGSKIICMVDNSDMPQAEKLATARLIAAAPDMLEALRAFDPWRIGSGQSTDMRALHDAQMKARAAIAKAEGMG